MTDPTPHGPRTFLKRHFAMLALLVGASLAAMLGAWYVLYACGVFGAKP